MNTVNDEQLKDFDNFFYYGYGKIEDETKSDVMCILTQHKRSLFYSRNLNSAGISDYENYPNSMIKQILIPYDIVIALSKRNQYVSNGRNGTKDRRIAISQANIRIEEKKFETKITVLYIPMADFKTTQSVSSSLGNFS